MTIDRRDLTSFDEAQSQWLGEAGNYLVQLGDNVSNISSTATVRLPRYTESVNNVMAPKTKLSLLRRK